MRDDIPPILAIPPALREAAQLTRLIPFVGAGVSKLAGCPDGHEFADAVAGAQTETVTYCHTDAIGSVRMITDASGAVLARYDYHPFGLALDQVPPPPVEQ